MKDYFVPQIYLVDDHGVHDEMKVIFSVLEKLLNSYSRL